MEEGAAGKKAGLRVPDIFLVLFLLTLPLSIRKIFLFFPLTSEGIFNEYTDVSLYLSDITLLLFVLSVILYNRNNVLSSKYWKGMFHVEHSILMLLVPAPFVLWSMASVFWSESEILAWYGIIKLLEGYILYIGLVLYIVPRGTLQLKSLILMVVNKIKRICSTWNISTGASSGISKMFHVEQIRNNEECSTWNKWCILFISVIIFGFIQSLISILQFINQGSIGLTFLKESVFSVADPGIAKIILANEAFIRAYGLFPHPNVLGFFLGITLLFTMTYPLVLNRRSTKMFHVEHLQQEIQNVPRGTFDYIAITWNRLQVYCSTWNILKKNNQNGSQMFHVEHFWIRIFYRIGLFLQLFALFLTFSKSAIAGFFIAAAYLVYSIQKMFHVEHLQQEIQNVPRGTFKSIKNAIDQKCSTWNISTGAGSGISKMFHVEHLIIIGIFSFIVALFFFLKLADLQYLIVQPLQERFFTLQTFIPIISQNLFNGLGMGQFVFTMQDFFAEKLLSWQFQPIHNLFLMVFVETGLAGLTLFILFIAASILAPFKNVPRGTSDAQSPQQEMFHVEHSNSAAQIVPRGTIILVMLRSVLLLLIFVGLFDHYLWDIQQGQLLFWLMIGLLSASRLHRY